MYLPGKDVSNVISLPLPLPYARQAVVLVLSAPKAKLSSLLMAGIFRLLSTTGTSRMVSMETTRTPSIPPCESRAPFSSCAVVTLFPSLMWILKWALQVAANLSAAPFPPCGSEKSIRWMWTPVVAPTTGQDRIVADEW